mgnify:CR=1 FL=1
MKHFAYKSMHYLLSMIIGLAITFYLVIFQAFDEFSVDALRDQLFKVILFSIIIGVILLEILKQLFKPRIMVSIEGTVLYLERLSQSIEIDILTQPIEVEYKLFGKHIRLYRVGFFSYGTLYISTDSKTYKIGVISQCRQTAESIRSHIYELKKANKDLISKKP